MKILRKVLFSLMALFLIYQSYELVKSICLSQPEDFTTGQNIFIAILINLFITGVFAFPGFVFPTNKLLGARYFRIRNSSRLKSIYQILGVSAFRKILMLVYWGRAKNRKKYFDGTRSGIIKLIYQAKQSETGHILAFTFILMISIVILTMGFIQLSLITLVLNMVGNLYPVILQRHHRMRIEKILS